MDVKTVNVMQIFVHISFENFDVISMVDKSTDYGKLLSTCEFQNKHFYKHELVLPV